MPQTQTVTAGALALTKKLMADSRFDDFILVGGTALALTIGHRQSIDIDLFTDKPFDAKLIAGVLEKEYDAQFVKVLNNGIFCSIDGIKTDLITHAYPFITPPSVVESVRLMSELDIAAMKLHAIVQSGSRIKDFTDVFFLLERIPLSAIYDAYEDKYRPNTSRQVARLALIDYSNINEREPVLLVERNFDWQQVKDRLKSAVEYPSLKFGPTLKQKLNQENSP